MQQDIYCLSFIEAPLNVATLTKDCGIIAKVKSGGLVGQAQAIQLAFGSAVDGVQLARALVWLCCQWGPAGGLWFGSAVDGAQLARALVWLCCQWGPAGGHWFGSAVDGVQLAGSGLVVPSTASSWRALIGWSAW
jgi:Ribosomal protein S9/S16